MLHPWFFTMKSYDGRMATIVDEFVFMKYSSKMILGWLYLMDITVLSVS